MLDIAVIENAAAAEVALDPIRARILAELAQQGGLEVSTEELARAAIGKFGVERAGSCARKHRRRVSYVAVMQRWWSPSEPHR